MIHFIPFHGLSYAIDAASAFIDHIFRLHGLPEEIISDRDSQFTSKFWKVVCQSLNIDPFFNNFKIYFKMASVHFWQTSR